MSQRIEPVRPRMPGGDTVVPVAPVTRRDPDREDDQDPRREEQPRRRPTPPPDDGLPHVDVLA